MAVVPWGENGPADVARRVLELPEHLSYPYVFAWEGLVYMVPEIGETGGPVSLFRARGFPDDWEFVCDLLTGLRAVDATLHPHDGRWYLFANIVETAGNENDELFLFSADTPLGPFQPHPQNPIVSDVRRARPAGRLFERAGRLIRPGQDCAGDYGRAIVFNEVLELSPERYAERPIGRLTPDWAQALIGCHTYA
ncbi:MAG: glucosamine inositolphosphorylceramide transferase family protein, partial [Rhodanobacteraceae bacterium]